MAVLENVPDINTMQPIFTLGLELVNNKTCLMDVPNTDPKQPYVPYIMVGLMDHETRQEGEQYSHCVET